MIAKEYLSCDAQPLNGSQGVETTAGVHSTVKFPQNNNAALKSPSKTNCDIASSRGYSNTTLALLRDNRNCEDYSPDEIFYDLTDKLQQPIKNEQNLADEKSVKNPESYIKPGVDSVGFVDGEDKETVTHFKSNTNLQAYDLNKGCKSENRSFCERGINGLDCSSDSVVTPVLSNIPASCYTYNTAHTCTVDDTRREDISTWSTTDECNPHVSLATKPRSLVSDNTRSLRRFYGLHKAEEASDNIKRKEKEAFEWDSKSDEPIPSSPLVRLKRFLSSKRRNRNRGTVNRNTEKAFVKPLEQDCTPLKSKEVNNLVPKRKKLSPKKLKKSNGLIGCCAIANSSKEALSSLYSIQCRCDKCCNNNNFAVATDGVNSCTARGYTEKTVPSSSFSSNWIPPNVKSDDLCVSPQGESTYLPFESHHLYADDRDLRSDFYQSQLRYCALSNKCPVSASDTFYSCFSELEETSNCDNNNGFCLDREDSFISCFQNIPTSTRSNECIYEGNSKPNGVHLTHSFKEKPKDLQSHSAFKFINCDNTSNSNLNIPENIPVFPSCTARSNKTVVTDFKDYSQETTDSCANKSYRVDKCSKEKPTTLSEGKESVRNSYSTFASDYCIKDQPESFQTCNTFSASKASASETVACPKEPSRLNLCSSNTSSSEDTSDHTHGASKDNTTQKAQVFSAREQVCHQCDLLKQRLDYTKRSLEKPLLALKSFLDEFLQKIHRSGTLCTGSPSWSNCKEGETEEEEEFSNFGTFFEKEAGANADEEFDHSSQNLEYQLENGVWTDSRSSLKALYDYEARSLQFEEEEEDLDCVTIILTMQEEETKEALDTGQKLTTADHRQACAGSSHVNRKESVREWLQSIGNGSESLGEQDKLPTEVDTELKQDHNANFEDDLFLGAEAKLIDTGTAKSHAKRFEGEGNKENLPDDLNTDGNPTNRKQARKLSRTQTVDYPATPPKLQGHARRFSLQQRFPFCHTDSFQSNDSGKTYSSVNEILQERSGNPFQILSNLGFGSGEQGDELNQRIPLRFLTTPSRAQGIEVEEFLTKHPVLKDQVLKQDSLNQPLSANLEVLSSKAESTESSVDPDAPTPEPARRNSLFTVARNVILLKRFSASLPQTRPASNYPQFNVHEGVTSKGTVYQSILHPDNSEFFAEQGLYDKTSEKSVGGASKAFKLSKLTKSDSIKEDPSELEEKKSVVEDDQTKSVVQEAQITPSHLTPKILVDEGSGCSDYYTGDPIRHLRKPIEPQSSPTLTLIGKTPSPAGYRCSVSTYGTSPYDPHRSPPLFRHPLQSDADSTPQTDELDTTTELGSLEILRGGESANNVGNDQKTSPILCLEQEVKESQDMMEATASQSSVFNGFNGHSPMVESELYAADVSPPLRESLSSLNQSNYLVQPSDSGRPEVKDSDNLSTASMPSILDDDIFKETKPKDSHSDQSGLTQGQLVKLSKRNMSWAGNSGAPPEYLNTRNTQGRHDRILSLRSKWQGASHFTEQVESPSSEYSGHGDMSPERQFAHPIAMPTVHSDTMLSDWDRMSETSSGDFGADSFLDRLQRIKDQHVIERDSQLEITMGKLGKVLREVSHAPEKLDDPVFMAKLKKECAKEPSYMEKLQKLKAQHEHKKKIHFEREFSSQNDNYSTHRSQGQESLFFQQEDEVAGYNDNNPYETEQRTSLFDLLSSSGVRDSETGRDFGRTEDSEIQLQPQEEMTTEFLMGDEVLNQNLTDTDKLLTGAYRDNHSELLMEDIGDSQPSGSLPSGDQDADDVDNDNDEDPDEVKDIVHLKGLTDDVLEILRHSGPKSSSETENEELLVSHDNIMSTFDDLLDFSCDNNEHVPSAMESGENLDTNASSLPPLQPLAMPSAMQQCDTSTVCDTNDCRDLVVVTKTSPNQSKSKPSTPKIVISKTTSNTMNKIQDSTEVTSTKMIDNEESETRADGSETLHSMEQRRLSLQEKGKIAESFELEEDHYLREMHSVFKLPHPNKVKRSGSFKAKKKKKPLIQKGHFTAFVRGRKTAKVQSADIEVDPDTVSSDLPNIKQPRGPLLRTGSAQSDSSGFADSVDSHSVADVNWDGRRVKQHIESGIETSSERTDTTVITSDSYSRQSSSTSSNTVTDITPLPDEGRSGTLSSTETVIVRPNQSSHSPQIFLPQAFDVSDSEDANNNREEYYEVNDQDSDPEDLLSRKKKLATSRGHLHTRRASQSPLDKTESEEDADLLGINKVVEELEIDPQKTTVQETIYPVPPDNDGNIFPDRQNKSKVNQDTDLEVAEIEVDLYSGNSPQFSISSLQSSLNVNNKKTGHASQVGEGTIQIDQSDLSSDKSHDLRCLMLEPIDSLSGNTSSQPSAKTVQFESVSPNSDNNNNSGSAETEYKQYEFPKIRLAERRKDIKQKGKQPTDSDKVTEGFAVPYKHEKYEYEDLISDRTEDEQVSSSDPPVPKGLNKNQSLREPNVQATSSDKTKMKVQRNLSEPGHKKPQILNKDTNNTGSESQQYPAHYKQYDFPKVRLGERRQDIKNNLKDEQKPSEDNEEPLIVLTGKEAPVDVVFPEGYERDRFRAKSKEIVAEAIKSAKEKLKQEEKATKKKKRFPWSHSKEKETAKFYTENLDLEVPKVAKKVEKMPNEERNWQNSYVETYALDNWEPREVEETDRMVTSSPVEDEEEETPTSPKKGWFPFKSGTKAKDSSSSKPPKSAPSKGKEDGTSHAIRKNADFVFKATLSPFKRIWTPDDHKAESVEEASLKKQMEQSPDSSTDVSLLGTSGSLHQEDSCSNDVSLAEELREYDAPEQKIGVVEVKISPKVEARPKPTITKEQFMQLVGDEEDYDDDSFEHEEMPQNLKPQSVSSEDSDTFGIDLEQDIKDTDSDSCSDIDEVIELEPTVSEEEINPSQVQRNLETMQTFDKMFNTEDVSNAKGKDLNTEETEQELKAFRELMESNTPRAPSVKYTVVQEDKDHSPNDVDPSEYTGKPLITYDSEDGKLSLDPPEMYLDNQMEDSDYSKPSAQVRPSWATPDHDKSPSSLMEDNASLPSHSVLPIEDRNELVKSSPMLSYQQPSQSGSELFMEDEVSEPPLIPSISKPSHTMPRQDSLLDKFFENPTFESLSESDESEGKRKYRSYRKPSIEDIDVSELTDTSSNSSRSSRHRKRGQRLRTSTESDTDDLDSSNAKDYNFPSMETSRRSGSDMDDKCVGTDLLDMSVLSQESNTTTYSKKMVVSKLSFEPQKRTLPVNDVAELILIIDNGEIKEVKSVDSPREKQRALAGVHETYDLGSDRKQQTNREYHSPPYEHVERRMQTRMSRDSGYASNFTSISDPQYHQEKSHQASVSLKVNPQQQGFQQGPSYIPVIGDGSVRSKVRSEGLAGDLTHHQHQAEDDTDGMSVMSSYSDISEHQVLSSMLKQSEYYGPASVTDMKAQIEGILQKSRWPLFSKTRALTKQNLVEEVKLMQHALQKYKMEFKALQLRANTVYREHLDELTQDEKEALENVEELRTEILSEIVDLEKALAVRMRNIIAGTGMLSDSGPLDLASLHVISQMIELLKEQVYHSNVVNSMCDPIHSPVHPLMVQLETSSSDHASNLSGSVATGGGAGSLQRNDSLIDHLALLQGQIQAQQSQQAAVLNGSLRELKNVLLDEIRCSIQSETQELKCKLENTETQLHELKQQISRGGTPHNLSQELILMDFDVSQKDGLGEDVF